MMSEDEERRALIYTFYQIYRPLQKRDGLRCHMHFDVCGDNLIEIWGYEGEKRGSCVCKVKEDTEADCYKRAIEMMLVYGKKGRKAGYGKKAV